MSTLEDVADTVYEILDRRFTIVEDEGVGALVIEFDGDRIAVQTYVKDEDDSPFVRVWMPVAAHTDPSPDLYEAVALLSDSFRMAHLGIHLHPTEGFVVVAAHGLIGDGLDEAELVRALAEVAMARAACLDTFVDEHGCDPEELT